MAINGEGKGSWRMEQKRGKLMLKPFGELDASYLPQIEADVADIGRFLSQTLELEITKF